MTAVSDSTALRLHWWKARPNFGDALSPNVLAHVSGRRVKHARPENAEVFALGSLVQVVRSTFHNPPDDNRPVIWGSGVIRPLAGLRFMDNVDIALLRGPISAALLNLEMTQFGDPGLLINEVWPAEEPERELIGIVPHHTLADDPALMAMVDADSAYVLIDPRAPADIVCAQIAACGHVFASSLHGLITADAYGVPNTWVMPDGQGWLKYHDYAASVGRAMRVPITLQDITTAAKSIGGPLPYQDGIDACRAALVNSFPAHLRATAGAT